MVLAKCSRIFRSGRTAAAAVYTHTRETTTCLIGRTSVDATLSRPTKTSTEKQPVDTGAAPAGRLAWQGGLFSTESLTTTTTTSWSRRTEREVHTQSHICERNPGWHNLSG